MSRWVSVCVGLACLAGCSNQNKVDEAEPTPQASLNDVETETAAPDAAPGGLERWDDAVVADDPSGSGDVAFAWDDRVDPAATASGERVIDPDAPTIPGIEGGGEDDLAGDLEGFTWAGDKQQPRYDRDRPVPSVGDDSELQGLSSIESTTPAETTSGDTGDDAPAAAATALLIDIDELQDDAPPVDVQETMEEEPALVDIEETMEEEPALVDIEETMEEEPALVDIEETLDEEPALVDIQETLEEAPVEEFVVVDTVVDEDALTPFAPMDEEDPADADIVWITAMTAAELEEQRLLAEEAEAIARAEAEMAAQPEPEPEIIDLGETEMTAREPDPGMNPDDFDEEAAAAATAAAAAALLAAGGDDEPEPEPEPEVEQETLVDIEDLMAEEEPVEVIEVVVLEEPAGYENERVIIDLAEIEAPPAAATAPPPTPVVVWDVTTPAKRMPPLKSLPRLDGTVGVVDNSGDWVYRSLIDTLVSAGSGPVSGRNSDFAVAVRREPRAAFQAPKTHTIGVSLPYHRGRSDLPRTRWLATIEVIIDAYDGTETLREVSIRVGSQGITGRDFDRDDLRRLREVVTQWADVVAPQISAP